MDQVRPATTSRQSKSLYIQVLVAVILGVILGHFYPDLAKDMKPLGDAFVALVRMLIAPIIFITVVVGIAKLTDTAEVGRIGLKAIVYFEVMTTLAMLIGLVVGHVVRAGAGFGAKASDARYHPGAAIHHRHPCRPGAVPAEHHPRHHRRRLFAAATSCRCC